MATANITSQSSVHEKVLACYNYLVSLDMSVMDFVYPLFWGDDLCRSDRRLQRARQTFNGDPRLQQLLKNLHRPSRNGRHADGKQPSAARAQMEDFAFSCVLAIFKRELQAYEKNTSLDTKSVDVDVLRSITLTSIFNDLDRYAPRLYASLKELMQTYDQQRRNTRKAPDTLAAVSASIIVFSRSQRHGKMQNLLSMFFKAEGLPVRSFDVLNAFGLSMSRSWTDKMTMQLAEKSMAEVREVVLSKPVCIPSDNLRIEAHVDSQRLDSQSLGVNCTGMCVVELPSHLREVLDSFHSHTKYRQLDSSGEPKVISWVDILDLDGFNKIHVFATYLVRSVLWDMPELARHPLRTHELLRAPDAIHALPHGPMHQTRMWALRTAPIDQGSYEGNAQVLAEILKQLNLDTPEQQRRLATAAGIPFAGDLLTCQRLKGLKELLCEDDNGFDRLDWVLPIHGFFHNRMNLEFAIFHNHRGNANGHGLAREINVLNRHGLSATAKQPNLHTLDEFLSHFWAASTLENWMWATDTDSVASLIQWALSVTDPTIILDLSTKIVRERQSAAALELLKENAKAAERRAPTSSSSRATKGSETTYSDMQLTGRILANRDLLLLQIERYAIRHGDVGLLDCLMPQLALFFKGGGHGNYGNDILEYLQWRKYESTPELRDLVHHCWLVNMKGHADSFIPVDEMQEHLNREQREWHSRAGANFNFDYLKSISPAIPVLAHIIAHVAENFDLPYRSHSHAVPDAQHDIRIMATRFHTQEMSKYVPSRTVHDAENRPSDFIGDGIIQLQKPASLDKVFGDRKMFIKHRSTNQEFESLDELILVERLEALNLAK